jgi:hypothetical protein
MLRRGLDVRGHRNAVTTAADSLDAPETATGEIAVSGGERVHHWTEQLTAHRLPRPL